MRTHRGGLLTSTLTDQSLDEEVRRAVPPWRMAAAIGVTALVLWVALTIGGRAYVVLMFGMVVGLVMLAIAVVLTCVVVTVAIAAFTGRRRIGGAITVTLLAFLSTAVGIVGFGEIPMIWVGFELVHLIVAVASALVLGLFFEPLWARTLGCVALVALIVCGVVLLTPEDTEPERSADAVQAEANFEYYLENGTYPMVADLPGATVVDQPGSGGVSHTLMITEDGGVLDIVREEVDMSNPEIQPCWYLTRETLELSVTDSLADYASWCVRAGEEWRMVDGTGVARMEDGEITAIRPAFDPDVALVGGDRAADADEIAAAWASLRPMTEDEVRRYVRWPGMDG